MGHQHIAVGQHQVLVGLGQPAGGLGRIHGQGRQRLCQRRTQTLGGTAGGGLAQLRQQPLQRVHAQRGQQVRERAGGQPGQVARAIGKQGFGHRGVAGAVGFVLAAVCAGRQ